MAILLTVIAVWGAHALDDISNAARATECMVILKALGIGAVLVIGQLLYYWNWKGFPVMFGALAAVAAVDFTLTFLVFRFLDSEDRPDSLQRATSPSPRG